MRFDWYSATISDRPDLVYQGLCSAWEGAKLEPGRGMHGYTNRVDVQTQHGRAAMVLFGGSNGAPHAESSGVFTDRFVEVVRDRWGDGRHYVTRMDAAEDYDEPEAFERLHDISLVCADRHRLKVAHAGDWHRQEDGRTIYVGSRKSDAFTRLYEKGKQLRGQFPIGGRPPSLHWVRIEAQVRPQKAARMVAASCSPEAAWGFARWTGELHRDVTGAIVPRVQNDPWLPSNFERAKRYLMLHYGPTLAQMRDECGDWQSVGLELGGLLKKLKDEKR